MPPRGCTDGHGQSGATCGNGFGYDCQRCWGFIEGVLKGYSKGIAGVLKGYSKGVGGVGVGAWGVSVG